eukprot:CAMPEP_0206025368 /NCGR_PEP_ID=MMETSP1464-20131121/39901_1 /ASSEMBLY_ACC=CAM_ASM_001124 /TAXON_ID=119497 /ORGANISM="Exanthemachrysis gayraliae, Strain RCC1523" /LENGTH=350 /DNA_ID=CAMNT_0053399403 /DNA_START=1 /DNA_END=1053 /DNA_ORIENTATION=-
MESRFTSAGSEFTDLRTGAGRPANAGIVRRPPPPPPGPPPRAHEGAAAGAAYGSQPSQAPTGAGRPADAAAGPFPRVPPEIVDDARAAAAAGMYGKLTCRQEPWQPEPLLCKRFGVPVPQVEMPSGQREDDGRGNEVKAEPGAAPRSAGRTRWGGNGQHLPGAQGPGAREPEVEPPPLDEGSAGDALAAGPRAAAAIFKAVFENSSGESTDAEMEANGDRHKPAISPPPVGASAEVKTEPGTDDPSDFALGSSAEAAVPHIKPEPFWVSNVAGTPAAVAEAEGFQPVAVGTAADGSSRDDGADSDSESEDANERHKIRRKEGKHKRKRHEKKHKKGKSKKHKSDKHGRRR